MKSIASKHNIQTLSWLTTSNIIGSLSQWCLLIILVKYFSTEDVGYFTYGMALSAPIFMLSDMQLKSVLIVEPSGENDNFRTYQLIRFITTTLATTGLIIYSFLFREVNWIIMVVIIYKASESLNDILNGYLQKIDKMVWMSKTTICKTISTMSTTFFITLLLRNVVMSLLVLVIFSLIFYIIINRYIVKIVSLRFSPQMSDIKDIIRKSFPLGLSVFMGSYITNYPRLTIENVLGPEMLAYYGSYSYLAIGLFQIHIPIQIFLRQRLSVCHQQNNIRHFANMVRMAVIGFVLLGLFFYFLFVLFGDSIICLVYNDTYNQQSGVLFWLIVSETILSVTNVLSIAVLSFNVYTRQAIVSALSLSIVPILSNSLILKYGLYGGCYISIIAAFTTFTCYCVIYYRRFKQWEKRII